MASDPRSFRRKDQPRLRGLPPATRSQVKAVLTAKGIPYSEIVMDRVAERISNKLKEYKNRELPHDLLALYIDVKIMKVRINESIMERAIYIAIGVDLEGNKFVLDYEVRDREDLDGWKSFLSGLVSRGVSKVDVIVSDDFSGLDRVVSTLFPSSQHQLCITHMVRNLMRVLQERGGGKEGYIVPQPTCPTLFSGPSQEAS